MQPVTGERFGRYLLGRRLGHGGMGVVYAATDTTLNRQVALKLVAPHLAEDPEFRARFTREATLLARLDSAHAVRIYDHGDQDGVLYIATQLVDGGDLTALVSSGTVTPALAVELVSQVLDGLADAHAAGVTHRDVKPANVLIRRTPEKVEAFLCDFGIARADGTQLTRTGGVSGSLSWMAPERHEGDDAGAAGDIYSAGCLLWFTLTGSPPYAGTDVQIAMGHLTSPVPQLPGRDAFSKRVNAVLARAMAKSPQRRYPTAGAMLADLRPLAAQAPGAVALPDATAVRPVVVTRRRRWLVPVAGCVLALALGGAAYGARSLLHDGSAPVRDADDASTFATTGPAVPDVPHRSAKARTTRRTGKRDEAKRQGAVASGRPAAPAPSTTTAAPAPSTVAPAAPPSHHVAVVRFRCWDGSRVTGDVHKCGMPRGRAGMLWLFPGAARCATPTGIPNTSADVERWVCHLDNPNTGHTPGVGLCRFRSVPVGRTYYEGWFGQSNWTGWSLHRRYAGWQMWGTSRSGKLHAATFHYSAIPWAISPSGATDADAAWMFRRMRPRDPSQLYGVRIS